MDYGKVIKVDRPDDLRQLETVGFRCDYCRTTYSGDTAKNCRNCGAPITVAAPILMWRGIYSSIGV